MSYLYAYLQDVLDIPASTATLIGIMCSAAMYFIRQQLAMPAMVFVLGPLTFSLSLMVNYVFAKLELFPLAQADQWLIATIFSATIGVTLGLCLAALLARATDKSQSAQSRFHKA